MPKVAILTINDNYNLGNRLQNYALQEVLKKHNLNPETIYNQKGIYGRYCTKEIKDWIKNIINNNIENRRYSKFMEFNKNIKFSKYAIDYEHIPNNLSEKYDCFFAGSDQIWNYTFPRMSDIDFLTFVPKSKRNTISASFGVEQIPEKLKEDYKKKLEDFNNISVREVEGKAIIEELTGRKDVEVLVDPTMMLNKEEWRKVSKKTKAININEKYILSHFLGDLSESRKLEIERVAKENNCKIVDSLSEFYALGPSEFLYLMENAFVVCTDSFHVCVFSILYNKPFIVFDREGKIVNMSSRINTLLSKFQIENRVFREKITEKQLTCDYSKAYEILEIERQKFNKFIEKVIYSLK